MNYPALHFERLHRKKRSPGLCQAQLWASLTKEAGGKPLPRRYTQGSMAASRYRHLLSTRILWAVVFLSAVLFAALSAAAMWAFPGGTEFDPSASRYRFWTNTFSDLGRMRTRGGVSNARSAALYHTALAGLGAGLLAAWWALATLIPSQKRLGRAVRVCGIFSVLGTFGVALTPADVTPLGHALAIGLAAVPALVAMVALVVGTWREVGCPRWLAAWATAVLLLAAIHFGQYAHYYWLGGQWTPAAPAVQKLLALTGLGFLMAVSLRGLLNRGHRPTYPSRR